MILIQNCDQPARQRDGWGLNCVWLSLEVILKAAWRLLLEEIEIFLAQEWSVRIPDFQTRSLWSVCMCGCVTHEEAKRR